ncbi:hypothetical protein D9615_008075 [Tricholomella constricta]|uniref:Extracellular membrane protein CFEM domain-containing protein n=1 Tax=Tricholomella constricta TaxID=117010 RepID=A0A8H5GVH0_9AGAR|nr:hypothetical protein D9615_008075 [Tricholomella constricta]
MVAVLHILSAIAPVLLTSLHVLANATPNDALHNLLVRQVSPIDTSSIPEACKKDCDIIQNLTKCTGIECLCTDSNVGGLAKCLDCAVAQAPAGSSASSLKAAQSGIDRIVSSCKSAGAPVNSVTITGDTKNNGALRFGVLNAGTFAIVALGATLALA